MHLASRSQLTVGSPLGLPRRALDGHHRSSLFADELMKSVACRLGACVGAILFERIRLDLDVAGSFVCQALDRILALRLFDSRDPLVVPARGERGFWLSIGGEPVMGGESIAVQHIARRSAFVG